jgi:hypothetical protein
MNDVLPAPFASWYSASKAALASASVVLDAEIHGFRAENTAYIAGAGDPAEVADAIEQCIRADNPPARVVVGEDAQKWVKLVHDTDPDSFARPMRAEVAILAGP